MLLRERFWDPSLCRAVEPSPAGPCQDSAESPSPFPGLGPPGLPTFLGGMQLCPAGWAAQGGCPREPPHPS